MSWDEAREYTPASRCQRVTQEKGSRAGAIAWNRYSLEKASLATLNTRVSRGGASGGFRIQNRLPVTDTAPAGSGARLAGALDQAAVLQTG